MYLTDEQRPRPAGALRTTPPRWSSGSRRSKVARRGSLGLAGLLARVPWKWLAPLQEPSAFEYRRHRLFDSPVERVANARNHCVPQDVINLSLCFSSRKSRAFDGI